MIAVEQRQETCLRAGRSFGAAEPKRGQTMFDLLKVEDEVVAPQSGALADGGKLGGLKMREPKRGHIAIPLGEAGQGVDDADQAVADAS